MIDRRIFLFSGLSSATLAGVCTAGEFEAKINLHVASLKADTFRVREEGSRNLKSLITNRDLPLADRKALLEKLFDALTADGETATRVRAVIVNVLPEKHEVAASIIKEALAKMVASTIDPVSTALGRVAGDKKLIKYDGATESARRSIGSNVVKSFKEHLTPLVNKDSELDFDIASTPDSKTTVRSSVEITAEFVIGKIKHKAAVTIDFEKGVYAGSGVELKGGSAKFEIPFRDLLRSAKGEAGARTAEALGFKAVTITSPHVYWKFSQFGTELAGHCVKAFESAVLTSFKALDATPTGVFWKSTENTPSRVQLTVDALRIGLGETSTTTEDFQHEGSTFVTYDVVQDEKRLTFRFVEEWKGK